VSAVALLAAGVAGQTTPSDDEFSMLNIPRPGALFGSGFGIPLNLGQLMTAMKDEEKERPPATRVHVIHLPPALAGLFRRMGQPKEEAAARPIMTMRFGPIAMPMPSTNMQGTAVSRPLEQLRTLASNCLPCSQVQSRMRSISIMHGPDGQTVKTTTETGADGEEHTTRTVSTANESSESEGFDGDNLINAILAPLMGGMPDIERIMQDAESVAEEPAAPKVEAAKVVSKDQAQQAVKTAISAQGLEYDSPEKRQELAASIAAKLGVSPDAVKVSAPKEDADEDADVDVDEVADDETDEEADKGVETDADQDAETEDASQIADELVKEFDEEEQDKKTVLKREAKTVGKVKQAANLARVKAEKQEMAADHLETLAQHMHSTATTVA